jgi:hypothetical protein
LIVPSRSPSPYQNKAQNHRAKFDGGTILDDDRLDDGVDLEALMNDLKDFEVEETLVSAEGVNQ